MLNEQMYSRGSKMVHRCLSRGALFTGVVFSKRRNI